MLFSPNICKCDIEFIQKFSKQEVNIVLHFTQNIVSIVANKATAELLCLSKKPNGLLFLNESTFLNKSSESMIQ